MGALKEFSIPLKGLRIGLHDYKFQIDGSFFDHFENSPIKQGKLMLHLSIDKRSSMYILNFDFEGGVNTNCDRCLAKILLPLSGSQRLLVKFSEDGSNEEDDDVIFISKDTAHLDVSQYAFEYICLAMPLNKVYDCEYDDPMPCNETIVNYLIDHEEEIQDNKDNPLWDALKKLK